MKSILKTTMMAICCLGSVVFTSCSKDDNNGASLLKFDVAKAEVAPGTSTDVIIKNGTQPFTAKASNEKIATVQVDKNKLVIKGIKEGQTSIIVTDKNKMSGTLLVNVATPLAFDKTTTTVEVGKEDVITIKTGKAPYTAKVKDNKIATATVKDAKITIKGVKAGTTTISASDSNKLSGTITVTVK